MAVQSRDRIVDAVRRVLAAEPHLRWAYLFGSLARGEPFRDVDVAVMPAPEFPSGLVYWGRLVAALEETTGHRVDLADLTTAELPFVGPMLEERIVVLDRHTAARRTFEAETTSRWIDFRPHWQEAQRLRELALQQRLRQAR